MSTTNLVEGNFIGTDDTATVDLGNSGDGVILIDPANHNIVRRNTIMHSGGAGVAVLDSGRANNITANSIDAERRARDRHRRQRASRRTTRRSRQRPELPDAHDRHDDDGQRLALQLRQTRRSTSSSSRARPATRRATARERTYLGTTTSSTNASGHGTLHGNASRHSRAATFVTATAIDPRRQHIRVFAVRRDRRASGRLRTSA